MKLLTIDKEYPLILASASPRRKRLLEQIGLPFRSVPCNIDEEGMDSRPSDIVRILAERKAMAAYSKSSDNWILGADTIVVLKEAILGKPLDREEARSMLNLLSGREHEVITGFSITDPGGKRAHTEHVSTLVKIKKLSQREITAYIATGEPFGKAGSYAIQGTGAFMVKSITGSYSNVVGLPIYTLIEALLSLGALNFFPME
ncbi:Maf family protein [Deltaproteobacteria bacterium]|nr:Maf family protein [Deltaproteobacteria bacterium]